MTWQEVFDGLVGGDWSSASDAVKRAVHERIASLVVGKDSDLRTALVRALEDDAIDEKEASGLILIAVRGSLPTDLVDLAALQTRLADGSVSVDDLIDAAVAWVGGRVGKSTPAFELLRAARMGALSSDAVQQALFDWLDRIGQDDLAADIKTAIASAHSLTLRGVVQLVAAYLITNKIDLSTITDTSNQGLSKLLVAALNKLGASKLADVLQALVDGKTVDAAKKALDLLGVTVDEAWLKAALSGNFDDIVLKELAGLLKRNVAGLEGDDAKSLAQALVDLFKGTKKLFAPTDERTVLGMTQEEYDLFLIVRRVIYAAMLAVNGGALVPTAAMARPHIFAAAAIQADVKLRDLVTSEAMWRLFAKLIFDFVRVDSPRPVIEPPVDVDGIRTGFRVIQVFDALNEDLV